jgi:hypothetical protein
MVMMTPFAPLVTPVVRVAKAIVVSADRSGFMAPPPVTDYTHSPVTIA